jgi:endonuclease/exonuclease/phosphatase family metal-dependent hydrolase
MAAWYFILLLLVPYLATCLCANSVFAAEIMDLSGASEAGVQGAEGPGHMVNRASLKVMTFNIQWQGQDGENYVNSGFAHRKPLIIDVLTKFGADIIGLQEASIEQRIAIAPEMPGFGMFPLSIKAGDECILYRLSRFVLMDSGHDYLRRVSETPGTNIGVRDFVWVYLHDRISGKRFYVLNMHLDHRSSKRDRQLDGVLIGEWIRNRGFSNPLILAGDFNGTPDQPRYLYITGQMAYPGEDGKTVRMPVPMLDTFAEANPDARFAGTTNSIFIRKLSRNQIDYVFVPRGSTVIGSRIIYDHVDGSYPSDHFPLLSEFELK